MCLLGSFWHYLMNANPSNSNSAASSFRWIQTVEPYNICCVYLRIECRALARPFPFYRWQCYLRKAQRLPVCQEGPLPTTSDDYPEERSATTLRNQAAMSSNRRRYDCVTRSRGNPRHSLNRNYRKSCDRNPLNRVQTVSKGRPQYRRHLHFM